MKKRDLFKVSLLAASAAAFGVSGRKRGDDFSELTINPSQTDTFKFAAPMPFNYKTIDEIAKLNEKYKKSKITSLYNNIPIPAAFGYNHWTMVSRGKNPAIKSSKEFLQFAKYAQDRGLSVCYLFNSSKAFSYNDYKTFKDDFFSLVEDLIKGGINNFKFANPQVASLLNKYSSEINLSVSTTFELHTLLQYKNLIEQFPNINLIDISKDEAQNFLLLKNLKETYPKINIELMLNEPCIKGCPARISHGCAEKNIFAFNCGFIKTKNQALAMVKNAAIYPWDLEYYSSIGINNFKFTPIGMTRARYNETFTLRHYLDAVEYGAQAYKAKDFIWEMLRYPLALKNIEKLSAKDLREFLPDIRYFIQNGHKCAASCNSSCGYCKKIAKKLDNFLIKHS